MMRFDERAFSIDLIIDNYKWESVEDIVKLCESQLGVSVTPSDVSNYLMYRNIDGCYDEVVNPYTISLNEIF